MMAWITRTAAFLLGSAALVGQSTENVLLVVLDDIGVDGVAAYREGTAPAPTPTLDGLAARGVLFRNAYAAPSCTPTRAALHTGRHGFRTGIGSPPGQLSLAETALPEILPSTYASALIGKWHLGGGRNQPNATGWDHFAGSRSGAVADYYNWSKTTNGQTTTSTNYATSENVDDAIAWIRAQSSPWVLSLNFNAPHSPYHEPPAALHTYDLTGQRPRQNPKLFYRAMLQALDTELGRLLTSLGSTTLANTNVIVLGDNGTPNNILDLPFRAPGKGSVYEAGVNVPLIVAGPSVVSPGREVTGLVHAVDLFHSIAELVGVDARAAVPANVPLDGISIVPYLRNATQAPLRELLYVEQFGNNTDDQRAARGSRYKLIEFVDAGGEALFDLQADPFEQNSLLPGTRTADQQFAYDRLKAELNRLDGRATWFAFGAGCAGSAGVPNLAAAGQAPRLGQTLDLTVANLGTSPSVVGILGFSIERFAGFDLPLDLSALGMPSCQLLVAADVGQPLSPSGGSATWRIPIPASAPLLGNRFYQQVFVVDPTANNLGAVLSNAGYSVIEQN